MERNTPEGMKMDNFLYYKKQEDMGKKLPSTALEIKGIFDGKRRAYGEVVYILKELKV